MTAQDRKNREYELEMLMWQRPINKGRVVELIAMLEESSQKQQPQ